MRRALDLVVMLALVAGTVAGSDPGDRLRWFQEAKFGMFIHFGPYSNLAGEWRGRQVKVGDNAEWIMHDLQIPVREYREAARRFNPVKFDAEAIAELAASTGMKYLVITAKHHDGFAMYHSKVSKYNIVDWTPYQRDPLKDLAEACRRRGIRFCVYYSHREDWNEPGGYGNTWDYQFSMDRFEQYLETKSKPQLCELLTGYGPLGLVWFDRGIYTPEQARGFVELVHHLQPNCLINGRVGNYNQELMGDYQDMNDNGMPAGGIEEYWETPQTLNETWGYSRFDHRWKSSRTVIRKLVEIVSKGGNYLLNIGPRGDGSVPEPTREVLERVGAWMKWNHDSIYGASACPLPGQPWGRCTAKDEKLYLHVFDRPENGIIRLPGLRNRARRAYPLLEAENLLETRQNGRAVTVRLPEGRPDDDDTVIVLELEGAPEVDPPVVSQTSGGAIKADYLAAVTSGKAVKRYNRGGKFHISKWTGPADAAEWQIVFNRPGRYGVVIEYAARPEWAGQSFSVTLDGIPLSGTVRATKGWYQYRRFPLGSVRVETSGVHRLRIYPDRETGHYLMYLKSILLKPAAGNDHPIE